MGLGSVCACIRLISGNTSAAGRCEVAYVCEEYAHFVQLVRFFADDRNVYVKVCPSAISWAAIISRYKFQEHIQAAVVAGSVVNIMHICVA